MTGKSKFQISRSLDERIKRIIVSPQDSDSEFAQVKSAYILGFNYGNVTNCIGLTTNYQLHHAVFPVVGLVFFRTSPTDEEIKDNLKNVREFTSSPNGLGNFKLDKNEHLFLVYSVEKGSTSGAIDKRIFNLNKGAFVRRRRLRLSVLDDPYCPRQVHRGSEELFNLDDVDSLASSDDDQVDHLIFFVHGVGGVCDVRFRSCAEVVADFKKLANNLLAQKSSPSSGSSTPCNGGNSNGKAQTGATSSKKGFFRRYSTESSASKTSDVSHCQDYCDAQSTSSSTRKRASVDSAAATSASATTTTRSRRVEFLPVSWHSCTRRQSGMNDQLSLIALSSVPKLRHFLNKVVMDAMLYASGPVYTQTILNNVGDEINRLYTLFMEKHPNFKGSVSLAGHSLGSVILFDLLAHQINSGELRDHASSTSAPAADQPERPTSAAAAAANVRGQCGNVSHEHHDINAAESTARSCSDYKNLEQLLNDMNLSAYASLFQKEHIDINTLLLLTDFDMKELNLPLGVRRKLGTYINYKKVALTQAAVARDNIPSTNTTTQSDSENKQQQQDTQSKQGVQFDSNSNIISQCVASSVFDSNNTGQYLIKYPQLKFKPRCFFAFGSPMPMFLNVRGMQNIGKEYKLPTCDRMLNIFHPYDPLAYRVEPLIDARFRNVEPILIPHHRGGKRIHVQLREGFARVGHDIKHRLFGSIRSTWSSFTNFKSGGPVEEAQEAAEVMDASLQTATDADVDASIVTESPASCEHSAHRKRVGKSASTSVEVEVDSFESVAGNIKMAPKQRRQLLKRQQLVRSQSDLNPSTLNSIIEQSAKRCAAAAAAPSSADDCETTATSSENAESDAAVQTAKEAYVDLESDVAAIRAAAAAKASKTSKSAKNGKRRSRKSSSTDLDTSTIGQLNGGRRLDYVLQETPIELFNEYIFAFTSHANYWQNEDSALILLNEIYQVDSVQIFDQFE